MIDYVLIISKKHPESRWRMNGDDYSGLEWLSDEPKPTKKELESHWDEVQKEAQIERVRKNRAIAFREEADPLAMKWQRGEIEKQVWLDKIEEIRERFPKPE